MHVSPPMCSLKMMKGSPIADKDGWVDVNKETLQHKNYGMHKRMIFLRLVLWFVNYASWKLTH